MKPFLLKLTGKLSLLVLLFFLTNNSQAQTGRGIVLKKVLDGANGQLVKDSSILVQDSAYFSASLAGKLDTPYKVRNIITFRINEYSNVYLPDSFRATASIRVYYTAPNLHVDSVDQQLTINYDTAGAYNMRSSFVFNNAHRVEVKLLNITTTASKNVLPVLLLENEMEVHPVFKLSCTTDAIHFIYSNNPPVTDETDEITVTWPVVTGADVYDLEWAYIDSSALHDIRYGNPFNPSLVFENNSTRVTIANNAYAIPLLYDNGGVLYFRVRAVQEKTGYNRIETAWSSDFSGGLGTYGFCGHQRNFNWQSDITFAEDGKRKIVVQYFDGSLRSRQTVTKDNTTNTTVVAETMYDYQGRPAIQVMPAPTLNSILKYTPRINSAINGAEYDKSHYDNLGTEADYLIAKAEQMGTSSGANQYYSPANPEKNIGFNKFIPDAEGYAFSETQYTLDNTGRVARQGGVGPVFQLGSGHEITYFYASPSQEDLDALFGTEAGLSSHYFKNMVRDANGQRSVTYLDMAGRTIATALVGSPDSVELADLPEKEIYPDTVNISTPDANVIKGRTMEVHKSHIVTQAGTHRFKYELTPSVLRKLDCNNNPVCYRVGYDLKIKITDDAFNRRLRPATGEPFEIIRTNFIPGEVLTDCNAATTPIVVNFDIDLPEGSYEITKTLTINQEAMDYYRDSLFLQSNVCTTLEEMIQQQRQLQQQENCFSDCAGCRAAIGEWNDFRVKYVVNMGRAAADTALYRNEAWKAYQDALAECDAICGTTTEAAEIRQAMLLDMAGPSGQYATVSDSTSKYSIFYTPNPNTLRPYQRDTVYYTDEAGNPALVYKASANAYVKPQQLSSEEFANNFQASWAEALLKFHPEYCRLKKIESYQASAAWDVAFGAIDTYAEARAAGYLNPTGMSGNPFPAGNDPLAAVTGVKSYLEGKLNNYKNNYSVWSIATILSVCNTGDANCQSQYNTTAKSFNETTICTGDLDMAWRNFRELYLAIKHKYINDQVNLVNCGATVTQLLADNKFSYFNNASTVFEQNDMGDITNENQSQSAAQNAADAAQQAIYEDNCKAYVSLWVKQLSECYNQAALDEIIPKLILVCKEGSDIDHPRGSSSVKPSSTNQYRSFEEVLDAYNTAHGITDQLKCNGQLITAPKAYNLESPYGDVPSYTKPDACQCKKLKDLEAEYDIYKKAGDANFSAYLYRTRGISITQSALNALLDACSAPSTTCHYLPRPITIPTFMLCNVASVCLPCTTIEAYTNNFKTKYPGVLPSMENLDSVQILKNTLYENYMNSKLGFKKQTWEYLQFMDSCSRAVRQDSLYCRPYEGDGVLNHSAYIFDNDLGSNNNITVWGKNHIADVTEGDVIAGYSPDEGNGKDALLMRLGNNGNVIWSKSYGGEQDDEFVRVQSTDGGHIAIGTTFSYCYDRGAIFIVKVDGYGNEVWNKVIEPGDGFGGRGADIIRLSDGRYAFGGFRTELGVAKAWVTGVLDNDGQLSWMQVRSSTATRKKMSLLEDADTLVMAGSVMDNGKYDIALMKQNINTGSLQSIVQYDINDQDNMVSRIIGFHGYYKLAVVNLKDSSAGGPRGALLDIDHNGGVTSAKELGSEGYMDPESFDICNNFPDGFYATQSTGRVYWHKFRTNNTIEWTRQITLSSHAKLTRIYHPVGIGNGGVSDYFHGVGTTRVLDESNMFIEFDHELKTGCADSLVDISIDNVGITAKPLTQAENTLGSITVSTVDVDTLRLNTVGIVLDCHPNNGCIWVNNEPLLCNNNGTVFEKVDVNAISECSDSTLFATSVGTTLYNAYIDSVKNDFDTAYTRMALEAVAKEKFSMTFSTSEYHYTLYYYDQAGNLVKTVPPAGVNKIRRRSWLDSVAVARGNGEVLVPAHRMQTEYRFNTLNQAVSQKSPDAGVSHFWYDRLGRIVASQNAEQIRHNHYSYTLYDELGRITEVGEITSSAPMTDAISRKAVDLASWVSNAAASKSDITKTVYDVAHPPFEGLLWDAKNLRNRVAWSAKYNNNNELIAGNRASGSFYNYDIHGNVRTLLQDFNVDTTGNAGNRFKKIEYNYDLISGKVNMVSYQSGAVDAFYHRYSYDAENRITNVETSTDSVYWENDAYYQYFKYGPLARMVLGQQQVQGVDYAYTLQGWLKGVNSTAVGSGFDMGQDGAAGGITAKDAYGYSLHYFGDGDYKSINSTVHPFAAVAGANKRLYNGNISAMSVNIPKIGTPMLYKYGYDVLNRLVGMDAAHNLNAASNIWTPISVDDFKERITYDPNGNILTYKRNGNATFAGRPLQMDSLFYTYQPGNNKLDHVDDKIPGTNYTEDLDDQDPGNYAYDSIGNLVADKKEGIDSVKWTVYGKIADIYKAGGTHIRYAYDVAGNRISKVVNGLQTRYVRDATGNVLGVYLMGSGGLTLKERSMYGSSRLGLFTDSVNVRYPQPPAELQLSGLGRGITYNFARNRKVFELANHLGNVLATVSDYRYAISSDGQLVDHYEGDVVSANDYYPFGMVMVGRSWNGGDRYRYGFNGKENDKEVKGEGNQQDYGMRVYDPRLGRFLSVDPLTRQYPYSTPYSFAGNNPIELIDENGEAPVKPLSWYKRAWYHATNQSYLVRLNDYAIKKKIDDSQITLYSYNNRNFAIVLDFRKDAKTGELLEQKQVFREVSKSFVPTFSSSHDSYNQEVDNYFDDNGAPIPTANDESSMVFPAPFTPGSFAGAAGALNKGFVIAGNANKSWTIYTFVTNSPKFGKYFGLTVDYARRMAQHGSRIIGKPTELVTGIADKLTARGIEQLFINYGRKIGEITEQINSINPKRVERYQQALKQAREFLKENYGDKFKYLDN